MVVELTKAIDSLPYSKQLVGKRFVILDPETKSGPMVVIQRIDDSGTKLDEYSTNYPVKGLTFLGYARLFNDSLQQAFYKNLRIGIGFVDSVPAPQPEPPKMKSAKEDLDGLRNLVGLLIQEAVVRVQSGVYGPPTLEELETCGKYHAILEQL